jgi:hypothetical protein
MLLVRLETASKLLELMVSLTMPTAHCSHSRVCNFTTFKSHVADPGSRPSDRSCSSSEGCGRKGPGGGKVPGVAALLINEGVCQNI